MNPDNVKGPDVDGPTGVSQPFFVVTQILFGAGAVLMVVNAVLGGDLSGFQVFAVIAIPVIMLVHLVRIYRRVRAVHSERPFNESEDLLVSLLWSGPVLVMLMLFAITD